MNKLSICLNPYFNGIYFLIVCRMKVSIFHAESLNPYFNGIYFLILNEIMMKNCEELVLILILMEYTF